MPSFFGQDNNSDPESVKRNDTEIFTMVEYLFDSNYKEMKNIVSSFKRYWKPQRNLKKANVRIYKINWLKCAMIIKKIR